MNSVSRIAARLGVSPASIFHVTAELGITPRLWLDERPYYDDAAVEQLRERMNTAKAEAHAQ